MLELYVTTLTHVRQIETFLQQAEPGSPRYLELMKLHRAVVVTAANLATKLRLTPRSTVDRYAPKIVASMPPGSKWPWEPGAELDDEPPAA